MNYQDYCLPPSNYRIIQWFNVDRFSPEQAFTSHWMSSRAFFFVRLGVTLYSTVVFWAYFLLMIKLDRFVGFFKAFTTMTFAGLHAYLVVSI
ncbi:hypothetical protein HPULCUR_001102 [Helicostylum pulchrum]|uniref:Uncharacterized protein n=1 Tax=Helicostylum pulchrum TaxID=562976 RepID=A0ABP9XNG1_9FUNG